MLLDSQLREAVAKTCLGQAGVAEADLHYQLATYFLEANQGLNGELLQTSCGYVRGLLRVHSAPRVD
jgi:hypothetical protein